MTAPRTATDVRASLELALANAVAEKGYAATTIADIVANARVSKRTFYEHFADKEECLLALYGDACTQIMTVLRGAGTTVRDWTDRVRAVTDAYLATLDAMLPVNRAVVIEMQAAGYARTGCGSACSASSRRPWSTSSRRPAPPTRGSPD